MRNSWKNSKSSTPLIFDNKLDSKIKFRNGLNWKKQLLKYTQIGVGVLSLYVGLRSFNFLLVEPQISIIGDTAQIRYDNFIIPNTYYTINTYERETNYLRSTRTIADHLRNNEVGPILLTSLDEQTHNYIKNSGHRLGKDLGLIVEEINCGRQRIPAGDYITVIEKIRKGRAENLENRTRIVLNDKNVIRGCI